MPRTFMDGTVIAYVDDPNADGNSYFGFVKMDGSWVIQKQSSGNPQSHTYAMGSSDLETAWGTRTSQTYRTAQQISESLPNGSW